MTTILRSDELTCPSCVSNIEKTLAGVAGVERAEVRFNSGRIVVEHDPEQVSTDRLVGLVREAGYESKVSPF
ncbi:MAG TPA: heavy-metal-associated domain-containing protein [Longimicrobiales bacterium]|nr:heavy-metal-associated domain-containing protein [Longimicrobiales bacterium]